MTPLFASSEIKLALPKGRMQENVFKLLRDAGINVAISSRAYRPVISLPDFETKMLKPQNIVEMLAEGSRDFGFAGADWVAELGVDLVELLDTGLDPVSLVAAAPADILDRGALPKRQLVVASEYEVLTKRWIGERKLNAHFVRSYGATEVFPPEDADCIIDITATGSTLRANNLTIIDTVMSSSTRLYANAKALGDTGKREVIERFVLLVRSVIEARKRVMLVVNVPAELLETVAAVIPCMREHTIASLKDQKGYAITAAVPRELLPRIIPEIKARGGCDIVVTEIAQLVA